MEVFPDGSVLAFEGRECVGQLELRVPYGLATGYIGLYYMTPPFRGRGLRPAAERVRRAVLPELGGDAGRAARLADESPGRRVLPRLGYDFTNEEPPGAALRRMAKALDVTVP